MSAFNGEFCDAHFKKYFELHPTDAIYYGIDGYDHLLNDYSDETYKPKRLSSKSPWQAPKNFQLADLDPGSKPSTTPCSKENSRFKDYEHAKEDYRLKWPDTLLADRGDLYTHRSGDNNDFAGNLLSRSESHTGADSAGHRQSQPDDANPPRLWTENGDRRRQGRRKFSRQLAEPSQS